jgi:hypothetical protein
LPGRESAARGHFKFIFSFSPACAGRPVTSAKMRLTASATIDCKPSRDLHPSEAMFHEEFEIMNF